MTYVSGVRKSLKRLLAIQKQKEELETEETNLHQLIAESVPFLPEKARTELAKWPEEEEKRRAAQWGKGAGD